MFLFGIRGTFVLEVRQRVFRHFSRCLLGPVFQNRPLFCCLSYHNIAGKITFLLRRISDNRALPQHRPATLELYVVEDHLKALEEAIKIAGGTLKLGQLCGISRAAVCQWKVTGGVPIKRVLSVEAATGVPRSRLRPDYYNQT
jgi:hypothetical protein